MLLMVMAPSASASVVSFSTRPAVAVTGSGRPRAASVSVGAATGGAKWWAPLVGWSGRANYIETATPVVEDEEKRSFVGGHLTEEKARQLRARMVGTKSFHDAMYHSAIASRLARSTA